MKPWMRLALSGAVIAIFYPDLQVEVAGVVAMLVLLAMNYWHRRRELHGAGAPETEEQSQ